MHRLGAFLLLLLVAIVHTGAAQRPPAVIVFASCVEETVWITVVDVGKNKTFVAEKQRALPLYYLPLFSCALD